MKIKIPVKNLEQSNWLMAAVSSGFLSIFLLTYIGFNSEVLFTVVQSTTNMVLVSFMHIVVLVKIYQDKNRLSLQEQRLFSYASTILFH